MKNISKEQKMRVVKRDGSEVPYDAAKIAAAIGKANASLEESERALPGEVQGYVERVDWRLRGMGQVHSVEEIQDVVIDVLADGGNKALWKHYTLYRYERSLSRMMGSEHSTLYKQVLSIIDAKNEEVGSENSNKDPLINSTQRDYMAGEISKAMSREILLPKKVVEAHNEGVIHFHDMDYFAQRMANCCLVNLDDMLQNGTVISGTMIEPPKSFLTACNIATQIVAQVASNQYGGQTISLAHLAPFVDVSRKKLMRSLEEEDRTCGVTRSREAMEKAVEMRLMKEVKAGIQTIQYQLVTLMTTNGQTPFVTLYMYLDEVPEGRTRDDLAILIREVLEQRMKGLQSPTGVWITPAFPKLIYVLDEDNASEGTKYWDLTVLSARCSAKRLVPDYISAKVMRELKGDVYPCMGCRSFLTPDTAGLGPDGEHKYYGRFNQGVVTINLVDVACYAGGDMGVFWRRLDDVLELCHEALRCRHKRLLGTPSDVAPILWQHGALARLAPGEKIDRLLFGNYSTISLGYAGLYEMCVRMLGVSHTSPEGEKFATAVMQHLNDMCAKWRAAENISYSLYGTPIESTTYKFARCLKRRYGIIRDVTDHDYITNSYHVNVREEISAFDKLAFEAKFQALSPGGAISYVEVPEMQGNIPAVLSLMQFMHDHIMYAEINTKSDYCEACGFDGEIEVKVGEDGKAFWQCPNCGNTDQKKMHVARRTCGYIGSQFWNNGRTMEIKDRVLHVSARA